MKKPISGTVGGSEREETEILAVWTRKNTFSDAPVLFMMGNSRINKFSAPKIGGLLNQIALPDSEGERAHFWYRGEGAADKRKFCRSGPR